MQENETTFEFCLYDAQEVMFECSEACDSFDTSCHKACSEIYIQD